MLLNRYLTNTISCGFGNAGWSGTKSLSAGDTSGSSRSEVDARSEIWSQHATLLGHADFVHQVRRSFVAAITPDNVADLEQ